MATRVYLAANSFGGELAAVSPAYDAGWEKTTGANPNRVRLKTFRDGSPVTARDFAPPGVSGNDTLAYQYVSDPLHAQTIAGTLKGMIQVGETNATDNYNAALVAKIVSNDGATSRGTLLATFGAGTEFTVIATAEGSIKFPPGWTGSGTALSSVDAQAGDRLVIEIGFNETSTSVAAARFRLGSSFATDLNETEGGTNSNPWLEFSQDINFQQQTMMAYSPPLPPQMVGNKWGYFFFTLPQPIVLVSDVTVSVGAALALGSSPGPVVQVDVLETPAIGLGSSPSPTVTDAVLPPAALGLGSTTAPVVSDTVPVSAALATGSTPAPNVSIGYIISVPPAIGLGSTPAPIVQVVKAVTASLAVGSSPAPTVNIVVPLAAALALGITPVPSVIIAGNVTVTPAAALAIGSAPTPTVQVLRVVTAATALGVTVSPASLVVALVGAANAQGITPTPTVIAGVLLIAASVGIVDQATATLALTSLDIASTSVSDATGADVLVVDSSAVSSTVGDISGVAVSITDQAG